MIPKPRVPINVMVYSGKSSFPAEKLSNPIPSQDCIIVLYNISVPCHFFLLEFLEVSRTLILVHSVLP